jgi:radical SAM protein (TIGR01212 family)
MKTSRYNKFSAYLRERFGERIQKITVDGGFTCPNRDGTKGEGGCIYCDNEGFSVATYLPGHSIHDQIRAGIDAARRAKKGKKFIVYFQSYSNTYAPVNILREKYEGVRDFEPVVSLAIGTRPDCVNHAILELINSYTDQYEVWIEYGLQSANNKTLKNINRGHTVEDFIEAVTLTRLFPAIKICVHVIFGLPGEKEKEMLSTIELLRDCKIDGIKFHPLHAVKETPLAKLFKQKKWKPLEFETYVNLVADSIAILPERTVIQRVTADCPGELLIAPEWLKDKTKVLLRLDAELTRRNITQGCAKKTAPC